MKLSRRGFLAWSAAALADPLSHAGYTASGGETGSARSSTLYNETYRPQFHFSPEKNWMNDPNGLVYYRGEYHLFYQYNPFAEVWGHMSWGHAVSKDLLHWTPLPIALREHDGIAIFSGSAVVDWNNTSGFGSKEHPPLIATFTGNGDGKQTQNIAYSTDRGRNWRRYKGNPVIDIHGRDFRDPKVFWYKPGGYWVMIVSLASQHKVRFYASSNLKDWRQLSEFGPAGAKNPPNWECPDIYPLPVSNEPGATKWVLEVGIGDHAVAGGSGGQYFIGEFDGKTFINDNPPERILWVDYGMDFYAAQTWSDIPDGRRIMLGWMDNWKYAGNVPTHPWRGQMSIPRVVTLERRPEGIRMLQSPVAELQALREEPLLVNERILSGASGVDREKNSGETLEILAQFELGSAAEFGLKLRKGAGQETVVGYNVPNHEVFVDRTRSGKTNFSPAFPGRHAAPLAPEDRQIKLHIFLDRCSVEVFANGGIAVITDLIFPDPAAKGLQFYAKNGNVRLRSASIWKLQSVYPQP
ncbi:MAG TPA: glycoside hydrolase family 32 protein [Terriglobia bacterium]|nr:glycoside hydrolase family 32 protein [Terriglobia bacterium]